MSVYIEQDVNLKYSSLSNTKKNIKFKNYKVAIELPNGISSAPNEFKSAFKSLPTVNIRCLNKIGSN